jgi:PAS domain S-box-containing protein
VPARILIIDDNQSLAANLRDVLEGARELDVEVALAPDAQRGLAAAQHDAFDVAVVDVKLPDASGVDLIRPLRAAAPHGEIVLVTGFATVDTAIAALRAGAFAFILKSFRPEELISTVEQALEKIALKREREEYERRYRALVDAADVLIVGLDAEGRIALFNRRLCALTGVESDDAIGRLFGEAFLDEADQKKLSQAFLAARDGDAASEVEVGLRDAVGAIRRVRWHLSGVAPSHPRLRSHGRAGKGTASAGQDRRSTTAAHGHAAQDGRDGRPSTRPAPRASADEVELVYGIGIDVTERRALERRAADAEALNAMAPLALGLAHEIRNPLNAAVLELHLLSRAIDRLAEPSVRDPMKSRVTIVEGEIRRLERLLTEFLELARPRGPQREPVDLARVVADVVDLEAEALASHQVVVTRALEPGCVALGDVEKLKQVVLNLVVNALDVMPEGGTLRVSVAGSASEVWMAFGDTGPGVDPTILAEIFDPFFTTKAAGTGLGLAIVRKIVDQHAGRVEVDTHKGEGATVRVVLPRHSAKEGAEPGPSGTPALFTST